MKLPDNIKKQFTVELSYVEDTESGKSGIFINISGNNVESKDNNAACFMTLLKQASEEICAAVEVRVNKVLNAEFNTNNPLHRGVMDKVMRQTPVQELILDALKDEGSIDVLSKPEHIFFGKGGDA